jgi:DNA polymerase I
MNLSASLTTLVAIDFEFRQQDGDVPEPVCMVTKNLNTGDVIEIFFDKSGGASSPPFPKDWTMVSYLASAELSCFLSLAWPLPTYIVDLYAECRNLLNGNRLASGFSLLSMMSYFGEGILDVAEKSSMRELAQRGGPYTEEEKQALLDYCLRDVLAVEKLFQHVQPHLQLDLAFFRGHYMKSVARIERQGIPMDAQKLSLLQLHWKDVRQALIWQLGTNYPGVFQGESFSMKGFTDWLLDQKITWPTTATGLPCTDEDSFGDMARIHPQVEMLRQLKKILAQLKTLKISVGPDGRNRYMTGVFGSVTGRNQPSNAKCIFGAPGWMRGFIQPPEGTGLAEIDFANQEFGIAACLSGDQAMTNAFQSGDPYITFAIQAGACPVGSTKHTHPEVRGIFKTAALGILYGIGVESLAIRLGGDRDKAAWLISQHKKTYRRFWQWQETIVDQAYLNKNIKTPMGWQMVVSRYTNPRTIGNFPMQATGSDILRLSVCLAHDAGVTINAMVHDAIVIEAPSEELEAAVSAARDAMQRASEIVLSGFSIGTNVKYIQYPQRLLANKHQELWDTVWRVLQNIKNGGSR